MLKQDALMKTQGEQQLIDLTKTVTKSQLSQTGQETNNSETHNDEDDYNYDYD